jgi:hypothetical protein
MASISELCSDRLRVLGVIAASAAEDDVRRTSTAAASTDTDTDRGAGAGAGKGAEGERDSGLAPMSTCALDRFKS